MKKILVTGGAGFLGSHLCERLLNEGNEVVCLDNYFTGDKNNILHLMKNPYFEIIRHDVTTPFFIEVDEIYNLAKRIRAKILQASTSEVYGDPEIHPQTENYWGHVNPIGERACYDEGKRCAETLFMSYYHQNNVKIKIARIFNTYGPRMHPNDGRVVSNFIVQALKKEDITLYGDGKQTRSFCYVDDLIDGIIRLMKTEDTFIGPVNLGNPNEFSIIELAEKVIKLTNSKSKIIYKPLPSDDPKQRQPDITVAKKNLNWEPKIQLEEGLNKTIEYFKNNIN